METKPRTNQRSRRGLSWVLAACASGPPARSEKAIDTAKKPRTALGKSFHARPASARPRMRAAWRHDHTEARISAAARTKTSWARLTSEAVAAKSSPRTAPADARDC